MAYEQVPGMTGSISAGGEYDNLDTVNSNNYAIRAAEDAAAAALSAAAALASEQAAAISAAAALASENNALASEVNSANSASASLTSAANAASSASNSAASASISALNASASATSATESATSATNSASSAAASATSASAALASQNAAATSESNSANSASTATTQAGIATTQATNAAASATAAANTLIAVNQVFDQFDDIYLGAKASDPTVDNDGNPLVAGQMYWNTTEEEIRFYNGATWERPEYTATQAALAAAASAAQASTSASNAATSASAASASASSALTSATNSANSAASALTSETNAAASASSAAASAVDAADSAAEAAAILASKADKGANSDITSLSGITGGISTVDYIDFDTTAVVTGQVGRLRWNNVDGTLEFTMVGGNVTQQIGQELPVMVKHADSSGLTNGTVVYQAGSNGANTLVRYAQANGESTSSTAFGVMTEGASGGASALCTTFGLVRDLNTSALIEGQLVYVSPTVAGGMTSTKPTAPDHSVVVGFCIRSHASVGVIFVNIQNGYELDELHDTVITSPATNDFLVRNGSVWVNQAPATARASMNVDIAGTAVAMAIALG